jgi:outer membrane immunogenic protein
LGDDTKTQFGWTLGGGVEWATTDSLVVRTEYLYDDYGSKDYEIDGPEPYDARAGLTASTIRIGVAYTFPVR